MHTLCTTPSQTTSARSFIMYVLCCFIGWIDMTGHTNPSTITISRVEGGGEDVLFKHTSVHLLL